MAGSTKEKQPLVPERLPGIEYNNNPTIERLVFICGLHRSGTTLIERLLSSQFDVAYLRASVPESEGQHMQSVYKSGRAFGGPGRFAFSEQMQVELDALLANAERCRSEILKDWSRFIVGTSGTLLEKSPTNLTKIAWLRKVFPGSRFVIVTRDPRAACAATQKWSKTPLRDLMRHWDHAYSKALNDFSDDDCTIIRYEDLCDATESEITRIASFLELKERPHSLQLEERHTKLTNTNAKYFDLHTDKQYGPGCWDRFGYHL